MIKTPLHGTVEPASSRRNPENGLFFRDPAVFELLQRNVFPALFEATAQPQRIRCWVPACGGGQEAYSLAMALLEYLEQSALRPSIHIFATDSSHEAVAKGRTGLYPR